MKERGNTLLYESLIKFIVNGAARTLYTRLSCFNMMSLWYDIRGNLLNTVNRVNTSYYNMKLVLSCCFILIVSLLSTDDETAREDWYHIPFEVFTWGTWRCRHTVLSFGPSSISAAWGQSRWAWWRAGWRGGWGSPARACTPPGRFRFFPHQHCSAPGLSLGIVFAVLLRCTLIYLDLSHSPIEDLKIWRQGPVVS